VVRDNWNSTPWMEVGNFQKHCRDLGQSSMSRNPIEKIDSFKAMKVLTDIDQLRTIEGEMLLSLEDYGYKIVVKEVG